MSPFAPRKHASFAERKATLGNNPLVNAICLVIDRLHRGFLGRVRQYVGGDAGLRSPGGRVVRLRPDAHRLAAVGVALSLLLARAARPGPGRGRQGVAAGLAPRRGRPLDAHDRRPRGAGTSPGDRIRRRRRDRSALAVANGRRRGLRRDAPGPLLPSDHRMGAVAAQAAVLPLVPPGQPGHDLGRPARMSRALLGRKRSAAVDHRRRARPHAASRASTPTTCWSTRRPTPGRSRCWIPAWADSWKCSTRARPPRGRCWRSPPRADFRWASTCGWDRATRPCTASWSTCR